MIYDLTLRFAAIHIPRCAGVAIARALRPHLSDDCVIDLVRRHQTAAKISADVGDLWSSLYRFAVIRNPCQIIESDYRLTLGEVPYLGTPSESLWHPRWQARVIRLASHRSFDRFVREEYLDGFPLPGGFWRSYCLGPNSEDLGVEAIRFHELPARWPGLCDRLGVPRCDLPRANHAPGGKPDWEPDTYRDVMVLCQGDFERFDFDEDVARV